MKERKLTKSAMDRRRRLAQRERDVGYDISEVSVGKVVNPKRRKKCEIDTPLWLRTYFPDKFYMRFSDDHIAMIDAVEQALLIGGDQAVAAPRRRGKTTLIERLTLKCILTGQVRFPVLVGASKKYADQSLDNIKKELESNELLKDDYPEVCDPIWALEGRYQRCNSQHHDGKLTGILWTKDKIRLPKIEGSRASGSVLVSVGIDAGIRGLNIGVLRPDLVLIDDPDTEESAWSETQIEARERIIERALAGLGGPKRKLARVLSCTIINRTCLAFRFTDPKQKPGWRGKRFASLVTWPENQDLWDDYIRLWQDNKEADPTARIAHRFYLEHREAMDRGAVVSNEDWFMDGLLPDGTQEEASALQRCFNYIARFGMESFMAEEQNDPPEELQPEGTGITEGIVSHRLNKEERRIVPNGTKAVTAAIDCGKWRIHWGVVAWKGDASGSVIDYGTRDVYPSGDNDESVERALLRSLHEQREEWESNPYTDEHGEIVPIGVCLVDSGRYTDAVYKFVREVGGRQFRASKGFGESVDSGARSRFIAPSKNTPDKIVGDQWFFSKQPNGIWIVGMNADYWKLWVHNRFLTPPDRPGSLTLWGEEHKQHVTFSRHIVAEMWEEQPFREGHKAKSGFVKKSKDNHYLDVFYACSCGASLCGIKLLGPTKRRIVSVVGRVEDREPKAKRKNFALQGGTQWR